MRSGGEGVCGQLTGELCKRELVEEQRSVTEWLKLLIIFLLSLVEITRYNMLPGMTLCRYKAPG